MTPTSPEANASETTASEATATPIPTDAGQERSLVSIQAIVRGSDLDITNAVVGGALGSHVSVSRGFVRQAFAGRSVDLRQGGAQTILSTGSVSMRQAGSGVALARSISVDGGGLVLFAIAPRLEVRDGGRVVFGPLAALAITGVVAVAVAIGAVARRGGAGGRGSA